MATLAPARQWNTNSDSRLVLAASNVRPADVPSLPLAPPPDDGRRLYQTSDLDDESVMLDDEVSSVQVPYTTSLPLGSPTSSLPSRGPSFITASSAQQPRLMRMSTDEFRELRAQEESQTTQGKVQEMQRRFAELEKGRQLQQQELNNLKVEHERVQGTLRAKLQVVLRDFMHGQRINLQQQQQRFADFEERMAGAVGTAGASQKLGVVSEAAPPQWANSWTKKEDALEVGSRVRARFLLKSGCVSANLYNGLVTGKNADNTYVVQYDDGDSWARCPLEYIEAYHDEGSLASSDGISSERYFSRFGTDARNVTASTMSSDSSPLRGRNLQMVQSVAEAASPQARQVEEEVQGVPKYGAAMPCKFCAGEGCSICKPGSLSKIPHHVAPDPATPKKMPSARKEVPNVNREKDASKSTSTIGSEKLKTKTGQVVGNEVEETQAIYMELEHNEGLRSIYLYFAWYVDWWLGLTEPDRHGALASIVQGPLFNWVTCTVILGNLGFSTYTSNWEIQNLGTSNYDIQMIDRAFLMFYMIEISLKLMVHRQYFFCNKEMGWNIFDFLLVASSCYSSFSVESSNSGTWIRALRIMKLGKTLRMLRLIRAFAQLRMILDALVGSISSLFWCITMMFFLLYISGSFFVQRMTTYLLHSGDAVDSEFKDEIMTMFGSIQAAMLTLFMSFTGGTDWALAYNLLYQINQLDAGFFLLFIAFIQIAFLNILTGMYVENSIKLAQPDRDSLALEHRKNEMHMAQDLRQLCKEMDQNDSGLISQDEFISFFRTGKARAHMAVLGIDMNDAEVFYGMFSNDAEELEIEPLVRALMRLKGSATSLDMQKVLLEVSTLKENMLGEQRRRAYSGTKDPDEADPGDVENEQLITMTM